MEFLRTILIVSIALPGNGQLYGTSTISNGVVVGPIGIAVSANGSVFVYQNARDVTCRIVSLSGNSSTFIAGGPCSASAPPINGVGAAASFLASVYGGWVGPLVINSADTLFMTDCACDCVRSITMTGIVNNFGPASMSCARGISIASNGVLYVGDQNNYKIWSMSADGSSVAVVASSAAYPFSVAVSAGGVVYYLDGTKITQVGFGVLAGGTTGFLDGVGAGARFNGANGMTVAASGLIFVCDTGNNAIRMVSPTGVVTTICGSSTGVAGYADGVGSNALFSQPLNVAVSPQDQTLLVTDYGNNAIRRVAIASPTATPSSSPTPTCTRTMSPTASTTPLCPASYFCSSGAPLLCPAGSYCPLSSINATLCPKGSFSNAGASSCMLCPDGTFTSTNGSTSCQQCPGGHYCPAGTSSWARLSCGRGNFCPDGSGAPTSCPFQVPPSGGWGALQVQGPAFLLETAHCLNHCFWNFTSGDGMLSKC